MAFSHSSVRACVQRRRSLILAAAAFAAGLLLAGSRGASAATIPGTTLTPSTWWAADSAGNTVAGGKVNALNDLSGNNNNANQIGSTAPTFVAGTAGTIKGKPYMMSNGTSDAL